MKENTNSKIEVVTIIKVLIFWKVIQMNRGIRLLNIPIPIAARTEIEPPFIA